MSDYIDYAAKMHSAMRGLMKEVLEDVSEGGLPGGHHFYITFETEAAGVVLSEWLQEKYPSDMTIVLQNWFDKLVVMPDRFAVTLNFGDNTEDIVVPFSAVKNFVDPSVDFGLTFTTDVDEDVADEAPMAEDVTPQDDAAEAEVVSLDQFRNRDR